MAKKKPSRRSNISSTRGTVSGPSRPSGAIRDAAAAKAAATELVAEAFPFNAAKPSEFEKAALKPQPGQNVEPPHPSVGGSTLSERNTSAKTGKPPSPGSNPGQDPLERVRVDSSGRALTTNQGVTIGDNQNSLKAGLRGPTLLEDFILREKITHFDHERIPERIVHARGSAAHGYFECYKPLKDLTRASLFAEAGKTHAGVRAVLDGCRRARLDGHRARRARLRREVLHGRGQLGPRRQQHSRVLHPGRDEVSRSRPRREAGAASRHAAGGVGARHVLGLRVADARVHSHVDVGHVRSRDSAQLPHDARLRRAHVSVRERGRRVAVREVPLVADGGHSLPRVGRGREDLGRGPGLPPPRPLGSDRGRRVSRMGARRAGVHGAPSRRVQLRRARRHENRARGARAADARSAGWS